MASRRIDSDIDRLYQLPPDEFTPARNTLARTAGPDAPEVRRLVKPPIAAWAVNQIHWKRRDVYDALIDASTELRNIHAAILGGRRADLREAAKAHDESIDAALKTALAILREEGHPATDATRQAILTTLRSLPTEDPPGRLTRTLQPGGFEMLAGLSIGGTVRPASRASARPPALQRERKADATQKPQAAKSKAEVARAEAAKAAATKALREAEQAARRDEFEAVRLTRDADKAAKQVEHARETFEEAQQAVQAARQALEEAKTAAATTARARDAAQRRSKEAERTLSGARRALRGGGDH